MGNWQELLRNPVAEGHFIQLYRLSERRLASNVGRYIASGLQSGGSQLVIADPSHSQAFCREIARLGVDCQAAVAEERLIFMDAEPTLARFMVAGFPDWYLYQKVVGGAMDQLRPSAPEATVGTYGEMVGLLWTLGQRQAALTLDGFWSQLLKDRGFSLFCSFPIDVFSNQFQLAAIDPLLCDHTHLLPSGDDGAMIRSINFALNANYGSQADEIRALVRPPFRPSWVAMPKAEAAILWIRKNLPDRAEQILRQARDHYRLHEPEAS